MYAAREGLPQDNSLWLLASSWTALAVIVLDVYSCTGYPYTLAVPADELDAYLNISAGRGEPPAAAQAARAAAQTGG